MPAIRRLSAGGRATRNAALLFDEEADRESALVAAVRNRAPGQLAPAVIKNQNEIEAALTEYETVMVERAAISAQMSAQGLEAIFNAVAPRDIVAFFSEMGRDAGPSRS
jgi:hypothetical protein